MHDRLASLEPFNPTRYERPVPGQHYVTYPHDVDVLDAWEIASSGESFELSGFMDVDSSEDIGEDVPLVEHEKGEPSSLSPDDGSPIAAGAEDDGSPSS